MKNLFLLLTLLTSHPLLGLHIGVGFGWNTIDEHFESTLITNQDRSGKDRYHADLNRLAPIVKVGHQIVLCEDWLFGFSAEWKYLNYQTPNENSSRGQILPNATFSSFNIFGQDVTRDFTSKTRLNNELLLLVYLGKEVLCGYAYVGVGTAFFNASNSIYLSSVHVPNAVGNHLISTAVTSNKIVWGGAIQAGYQYYLCSNYYIDCSYTYLQTGRYLFNNTINAAIFNGSDTPGPTTLFLKRDIEFTAQELTLSMNFVF